MTPNMAVAAVAAPDWWWSEPQWVLLMYPVVLVVPTRVLGAFLQRPVVTVWWVQEVMPISASIQITVIPRTLTEPYPVLAVRIILLLTTILMVSLVLLKSFTWVH